MFLSGAIFGGGISALYFSRDVEVKVLTKTEYKEIPAATHSIQNDSREQTKFPEYVPEDSVHDADEVGKYDSQEEDNASQMEKFERSMAGDQEPDMPVAAPEEASPENPVEAPVEEPSEN